MRFFFACNIKLADNSLLICFMARGGLNVNTQQPPATVRDVVASISRWPPIKNKSRARSLSDHCSTITFSASAMETMVVVVVVVVLLILFRRVRTFAYYYYKKCIEIINTHAMRNARIAMKHCANICLLIVLYMRAWACAY